MLGAWAELGAAIRLTPIKLLLVSLHFPRLLKYKY